MTPSKLIEKYQNKIAVLDKVLNNLERNIQLAKEDKEKNKKQLDDMNRSREGFLRETSCYIEFIDELRDLN